MNVFIDIETTGLTPWKYSPIAMAFIVCDEDLHVREEIVAYSRPMHDREMWNEDAAKIHGIDIDEAYRYPTSDIVSKEIYAKIMSHGKYNNFICHAQPVKGAYSTFDYKHLFAWFWANDMRAEFYQMFGPAESTQSMQRKITLEKYGIESQRLDVWAKKLNLDLDHHNAKSDALACREIYKFQKEFKEGAI